MDMILNRPETVADLPSPLAGCKNAADWHNVRRPAILRLLEEKLFGEIPPAGMSVSVLAAALPLKLSPTIAGMRPVR